MTRRKQNCPKRMKWEGGEGEEPPEEVQEEDDGDEDDDETSRHSSGSADLMPDSRITSPITVLQEENTQPIDLAGGELLPINRSVHSPISTKDSRSTQRSSTTPPPPILERCSSGESIESGEDETATSVFHPVPPRLPTMVSASSPLISSSSSPPPLLLPANASTPTPPPPAPVSLKSPSMTVDNVAVLDFSTKKRSETNISPVLNLSKSAGGETNAIANGPLDLSLGSNKKRELEDPHIGGGVAKKPARMPTTPISPWSSPLLTYQLPYFASGGVPLLQKNNTNGGSSAAGVLHHSIDPSAWNGKAKISSDKSHFGMSLAPSDATKALEKMSELSKLGVVDEFRPVIPLSPNLGGGGGSAVMSGSGGGSGGGGGRHSAWQSHWLNKGAEQAKDVLKCVWCKQSFPSLAAMTTHMQEAKHCGVNVPGVSPLQPITAISTSSQTSTTTSSVSSSSSTTNKSNSDLNLLIKETMPLPRKLVRGQDVWLGKGAEQTRQILKCMWCGQSFRSLAEMTSHMQQTQHYTNIISQEQIISWKSAEDGKGSGASGGGAGAGANAGQSTGSSNVNSSSTNSHVSAVLTCKVCDQAFSSLKELSNHMVKNSHYKEHIMRSITESGGRRRQTREKRKKSLPVRKLLELERAQNELKNGDNMMMTMMMMGKQGLHSVSSNRITCEKCGDKIDMAVFVDHIRICVGANATLSDEKKNLLKNALMSSYNNASEPFSDTTSSKSGKDSSYQQRLSPKVSDLGGNKDGGSGKSDSKTSSSSPSVLNAIEKLIEKSFDPRSRHAVAGYPGCQPNNTSPIGSSILKRLGIDESVDYTKPLMDVNLQAAKAYMLGSHQFHNSHYDQNYYSGRRERSGSESSSVSERGSSRHESSTPDRKLDDRTPRTTPEKRLSLPPSPKSNESAKESEIKSEPKDNNDDCASEDATSSVVDESPSEMAQIKSEVKIESDDKVDDSGGGDSGGGREANDDDNSNGGGNNDDDGGGDNEHNDECKKSDKHSSRRTSAELSSGEECGKRKKSDSSPPLASPSRPDRASISPNTNMTGSPTNSERSVTPRSSSDKKASGSLGALSSMFDSLSGTNTSSASSEAPAQSNKASNHPLAALQKLCDKTETHHHSSSGGSSGNNRSSSISSNHLTSGTPQSSTPGAILAFSWACNDAVVTDSIMKCAFCDTSFISKGAYRHHLSKMHFVKDGVIPDPVPLKSPASSTTVAAVTSHNSSLPTSLLVKNSASNLDSNCKAATAVSSVSSSPSIKSPPQSQTFDESPHSKFLKYTELAKQLSSKYV